MMRLRNGMQLRKSVRLFSTNRNAPNKSGEKEYVGPGGISASQIFAAIKRSHELDAKFEREGTTFATVKDTSHKTETKAETQSMVTKETLSKQPTTTSTPNSTSRGKPP